MAQKRINWSSYHIDPKKDNIGVYVSIGKNLIHFCDYKLSYCQMGLLFCTHYNYCVGSRYFLALTIPHCACSDIFSASLPPCLLSVHKDPV